MMKDKFSVEIDFKHYGLRDVKEWADELEVKPKELVDKMINWDAKKWAIFAATGFSPVEIDDIDLLDDDIGTETVHIYGEDIKVLTDDEAEKVLDDMLDSYIEYELDIPNWIRPYFDEDAWKKDQDSYDYLGECENIRVKFEEDECSEEIYIYRQ